MSSKVRAKKKQSSKTPSSMITSLPDEIIVDIVARVPRCDYPSISLVSKSFRSLIASPELYTRRSLLGCTEHSLYAVLYNCKTKDRRFYILRRKFNGNGFFMIWSVPRMPSYANYVAVGSKIYVIGGYSTRRMLSIDGRSHTVQLISDIPTNMATVNIAGIIDGKIYVIRDYEVSSGRCTRVMVLDTETQMWEPEMTKPDVELGALWPEDVVVMEDKIYIRISKKVFVYGPEENKVETDEMLNSKRWEGACVVDNVLYYYDPYMKKLRAYDPKLRCWRVVKGLEEFFTKTGRSWDSKTVSYGGKLVLFFHKNLYAQQTTEIWCVEIALERRQGGEI